MARKLYAAWRPGGPTAHAAVEAIYALAQEGLLRSACLDFPETTLCVAVLRITEPAPVLARFHIEGIPCAQRRRDVVEQCQSDLLRAIQSLSGRVQQAATVADLSGCDVALVETLLQGTPLSTWGTALRQSAAALGTAMNSTAPGNIRAHLLAAHLAASAMRLAASVENLSFLPPPAREALLQVGKKWGHILAAACELLWEDGDPDWHENLERLEREHLAGGVLRRGTRPSHTTVQNSAEGIPT